jgi:hypothetical protein
MLPTDEIVVHDIAGNRALVSCTKPSAEVDLRCLGFVQDGDGLVRAISDENDRKSLVEELVRLNALFSEGRDWSPAELLHLYREQGFVTAPFKVIGWRTPTDYSIRDY